MKIQFLLSHVYHCLRMQNETRKSDDKLIRIINLLMPFFVISIDNH